ncbi:MAG: acetolactate synthase small subunit [Elusimicrobia bacterium RIFOXYA2_FULL_50_26]|nr:MAG: acetolactate synthase small subunit [Elusimicrobia bacterium RIFOXYA2_FULL_50_26]OGS25158.1 MAG: acetolactate synthase small subunit [Elusimicrobia bacterium RIFOXYB2_FULL_50_12]
MRHAISVLVENKFGVLARIATLFAARGFNIDSLSVGETEDPEVSRMTIIVRGDDRILEQVEKQLNKLVDIIKVLDFKSTRHVERDLALIKVNADKTNRSEILQITSTFRSKIIDVSSDSVIIEITGSEEKIEAFINMLRPFGIKEMSRTGIIAMARG